jgi:predicted RecB family nuclease
MSSRITDDVIDALQYCRLKAYFLLHGEQGGLSGYEKLLVEQRTNLQPQATDKIRHDYSEPEVATDVDLSVADLRKGASFILGARLEDDRYAVHFDGLRKIDSGSTLGDFLYEPVMFCAAPRVRATDRRLLAARAFLLARIQGASPVGGIIYLGRNCARTSIRFGSALTAAESLLREAERLQRAEAPPKLRLNDHCHICAFRDRCRNQAVREDSLSLLRGIGAPGSKRELSG